MLDRVYEFELHNAKGKLWLSGREHALFLSRTGRLAENLEHGDYFRSDNSSTNQCDLL